MRQQAYAYCPPGLEKVVLEELRDLGIRGRAQAGGVAFEGSSSALATVLLGARTPSGLRLMLGETRAGSAGDLLGGVRKMNLAPWLWPRQPTEVRITSRASRLRGGQGLEKRVVSAIADAVRGPRRCAGRPSRVPARFSVRVEDNLAELSLDLAGQPLHKRGWRKATAKAPIRENLAACILWGVGWRPGVPLLDPMCGSGTFPIEAAVWARGRPIGGGRSFAWQNTPTFDSKEWNQVRSKVTRSRVRTDIWGSDRDAGAIRAARSNSDRAVVDVQWQHCSVRDVDVGGQPGWVVCNPPWGRRIEGGAKAAWESLGRVLRQRFLGWNVAVVAPSAEWPRLMGLSLQPGLNFRSGGIAVSVWSGKIAF